MPVKDKGRYVKIKIIIWKTTITMKIVKYIKNSVLATQGAYYFLKSFFSQLFWIRWVISVSNLSKDF